MDTIGWVLSGLALILTAATRLVFLWMSWRAYSDTKDNTHLERAAGIFDSRPITITVGKAPPGPAAKWGWLRRLLVHRPSN